MSFLFVIILQTEVLRSEGSLGTLAVVYTHTVCALS